jgi:lipopolysaccharide transport system ATP-binding protein
LLGGAFSAASLKEAISFVDTGKKIKVEFTFNCHLNPGIYFINAGVYGNLNTEEIVLHRKIDVVAFRVLPIKSNIETEVVHFGFNPVVNFL